MKTKRSKKRPKRKHSVSANGQHNGNGYHWTDDELTPGRYTVSVYAINPSPENEILYRERTTNDADFARLVQSVIRTKGVEQDLLVSRDRYIMSGHQRRLAVIEAGFDEVPIIVKDIRRADHTSDEWVKILREYNAVREKSFAELVREKIVDIDPDEAVRHIVSDRINRTTARVQTIDISSDRMKRSKISPEKRGMADAVLSVLKMLEEYLPVSLRAIHYRLLNEVVWRNTRKKLRYKNDLSSYKDLSDLATRMRLTGEIPWDSICDETRPVTEWSCWNSGADFIDEKCREFLKGFALNLIQSQSMHLEIVVEKLTVKNFVEPVAGKYCMRVVTMRGNSGIDARYQIAQRFKASGKSKLFLFCLGDCDPDGDSIVDTTLKSMRDDFHVHNVEGTRVAMTHEQADNLKLPKMLQAKTTSSNWPKFEAKHGRPDCYELEAVDPEVLQEWLDQSIRGVLDIEAFNHDVETERSEAPAIMARRRAVLDLMKSELPD